MIDRPPENKSLTPGSKPPPEAIRRAREDFDRTAGPIAAVEPPRPPAGPRIVGHGTCPRCRVDGDIWIEGEGDGRHLRYVGCKCPK